MGDLEGGLFQGDFERQVDKSSGNGTSLSMGLCNGNLERRLFAGNFKRYLRGLWRGNIFLSAGTL
jgi:hypothetical protein